MPQPDARAAWSHLFQRLCAGLGYAYIHAKQGCCSRPNRRNGRCCRVRSFATPRRAMILPRRFQSSSTGYGLFRPPLPRRRQTPASCLPPRARVCPSARRRRKFRPLPPRRRACPCRGEPSRASIYAAIPTRYGSCPDPTLSASQARSRRSSGSQHTKSPETTDARACACPGTMCPK